MPPPAKKGGCMGCSMGCLGCLGVIALVLLLMVGGGYFFLVAQAQAGVPSPAALLVASTPVDVGHNDSGYRPATSGQSLDAGSSVRTGPAGHATIQFPDGSLVRVAPNTIVTIQAAQLTNNGNLKSANILQKIGRTLSTVQHLAGGASFQIGGHSVSAEVRGTEFEVLVRQNNTNQIKVFDGTVRVSGKTTVTLTANQQIEADPNGALGNPQPIQADKQDPFALAAQCSRAVAAGSSAGTLQTSVGDNIATGQTAEVDYRSSGGIIRFALCYPGSFMTLSVIDPNGAEHASRNGTSGLPSNLSGPPGLYRAIVHAIDVPGGEPFAVSFATNSACVSGKVDTGSIVRETLTNAQLAQALSATGITVQVQGTSSSSARIYYYSNLGGTEISWTIDFYAATPNLGWVITQVTVKGINITTQVVDRITSAGQSVSSIPSDYIVDRVYSCVGPDGNMMVIEGHR